MVYPTIPYCFLNDVWKRASGDCANIDAKKMWSGFLKFDMSLDMSPLSLALVCRNICYFGCQNSIDSASKSSKFQAAGLNLHGRYLPDQLRVGPGTQHDVMTILRSKSKWRSSPTGIWQMLHSTFRLRTSISTHKRETLKIGQVWPSSNTLKCSNYSRTRYRLGQCRAHLRWLPRTWHQSGFRTGLASEKCGGAPNAASACI